MVRRYSKEELARFLFEHQDGRCAWCGTELDWDSWGRPIGGEDSDGHWELHHHPSKSRRDDAFG